MTCGAGGVPGVCAPTNCTAITCNPMGGGQYCGRIGNGCGGVLDCPSCPGGMACGTGAQAGVCPGMPGTGGACTGLACQINKCTGMPKTTVKGTVYDPGGKLPLYNVMVYVPNAALDPIVEGVTCDKCGTIASGQPVASALTDPSGNFTMQDVPVGTNIPVVIQTGKWRRQITLPTVKACQDNVFAGADTFRLPKNQSEGHLPKIAMTRGKADSLECLMRRIGISDTEFTNPDGNGRINIYYETGGGTGYDSGTAFPPVSTLFNQTVLNKYDMMVISCHGESARSRAQPLSEKQIVKSFVDAGGRVFASHFSFGYFRGVPGTTDAKNFQPTPWPLLAEWDGNPDPPYAINTSFAKGMAFADWLVTVSASTTRGAITMTGVEGPAMSLYPGYNSQSWITTSRRHPLLQRADAGRESLDAGRAVRALRQYRHPRRQRRQRRPVPIAVRERRADAAGEGVGVPDLRAVGLPAARQPDADAAPGPAARRAEHAAATRVAAARAAAAATAATAADGRLAAGDHHPSHLRSGHAVPSRRPRGRNIRGFKLSARRPAEHPRNSRRVRARRRGGVLLDPQRPARASPADARHPRDRRRRRRGRVGDRGRALPPRKVRPRAARVDARGRAEVLSEVE